MIEYHYNADLVMSEINRVTVRGGAPRPQHSECRIGGEPWVTPGRASLPSHEVSFQWTFGQFRNQTVVNGHIESFTRRALKEHVMASAFDTLSETATAAGGIRGIVHVVGKFFSSFPSLASHTALCAKSV